MRARDIVRIARDRAGLTQDELAARSGRPRETIARWESGRQEPAFDAVTELLRDAGLELVVRIANQDPTLRQATADQLELEPLERLSRLLAKGAARDVIRALRWLAQARTPSVVIGSVGATLLGGPQRPDASQVEFVTADAIGMDRELREGGLTPIDVEDRWAATDARAPWTLPGGGTLALATNVPGTHDYRDLRRSARPLELAPDTLVLVAHPRDLLRIADASSRDSERARIPGLQALLEEST